MKPLFAVVALLALAGCANSACSDPDVLAYVNQARRSHDLYALGLSSDPVRTTPLPPQWAGRRYNTRTAMCSAWMLRRNPAFGTASDQPLIIRQRQDFWVERLASGYEVGLVRR